jgi:hypothetical protein
MGGAALKNTLTRVIIFTLVAWAAMLHAPALADVEVRCRLLDYFLRTDGPDKLKIQVMEITGGSETADWIQRGKVLVIPVILKKIPPMHLFDQALVTIAALSSEAMVTGIKIEIKNERQIPLPMELILSVEADRPAYKAGETVTLTIKAFNGGKRSVILPLPTAQQYDFVIKNRSGEQVWRWSGDKAFIALLSTMIFARREQKSFSQTWDMTTQDGTRAAPGTYYVEGFISTAPELPAGRAKFEIK